LADISVD